MSPGLSAGFRAAADFFKVVTMSLIKLMSGLLFVAIALVSNCKNASIRKGSLRSIRFLMLSKTVLMLIKVAGEGGDWEREVGFEPLRNIGPGLEKKKERFVLISVCLQSESSRLALAKILLLKKFRGQIGFFFR